MWNNSARRGSFHSKPLVIKDQDIFLIIKALLLFRNAFVVIPIQNIVCSNPYPYKLPVFFEIYAKHLSPTLPIFEWLSSFIQYMYVFKLGNR